MQYINGEKPIRSLQVAWYDMENEGRCFDEDCYKTEQIPQEVINLLMQLYVEDDANCLTQTRVFVQLIDGREYELVLKNVTGDKTLSRFSE